MFGRRRACTAVVAGIHNCGTLRVSCLYRVMMQSCYGTKVFDVLFVVFHSVLCNYPSLCCEVLESVHNRSGRRCILFGRTCLPLHASKHVESCLCVCADVVCRIAIFVGSFCRSSAFVMHLDIEQSIVPLIFKHVDVYVSPGDLSLYKWHTRCSPLFTRRSRCNACQLGKCHGRVWHGGWFHPRSTSKSVHVPQEVSTRFMTGWNTCDPPQRHSVLIFSQDCV